jgi:hypothetical protein
VRGAREGANLAWRGKRGATQQIKAQGQLVTGRALESAQSPRQGATLGPTWEEGRDLGGLRGILSERGLFALIGKGGRGGAACRLWGLAGDA